jgi:transcription-repair coupling factor (superfamily II helicase)
MDLSALLGPIRQLDGYRALLDRLREGLAPARAPALPRSARTAVAAALASDLPGPVLYLTARQDRLLTLSQELAVWNPQLPVRAVPEPDPLFYEMLPWGRRTKHGRALALARLAAGSPSGPIANSAPGLLLASARAALTRTLSPRQLAECSLRLAPSQPLRLEALLEHLLGIGYEPANLVVEPGQFSRRGGILDLWPPASVQPVRLELFGDDLESLREFDPASQRSQRALDELWVTAAREGIPRLFQQQWERWLPPPGELPGQTSESLPLAESFLAWMNPESLGLLEHLPAGGVVLLDDRQLLEEAIHEVESQGVALREKLLHEGQLPPEAPLPYLTLEELDDALGSTLCADLGLLSGEETEAWEFAPGPRFGGQLRPLLDHLVGRRLAHEPVVLVSRQASRLAELWAEVDSARALVESLPAELAPGEPYFLVGALGEGWSLSTASGDRIHLITDGEIFGWSRPRPRRRPTPRAVAPETAFADLARGDYVVHADYGVGRFEGLVSRTLEGALREFLLVSYAEGDQLYVPIHQVDRLTRYLGVDGSATHLSRLGSQEWERSRAQAQRAVEEVARELLDLYARRLTVEGHAFSSDTPWQYELEASFPYIETEDQARALAAVKGDMERPLPMDRLICGDAGYGKTEVALRAAFKAVMDGKQVAMLVPTTILAQQHYDTFRQRLAPFPVEVEMLSRFRSRPETAPILEGLHSGSVDIVIGTHRLLQQDVHLKDLGLLIIDEEQRFGVTHKEHLKRMRTTVDVLTLTATPIPRTLYMALTGVRDISTIDTAPEERLPVITQTGPYNPERVRQAVLRELERGGQVFFVHNRVQTIQTVRHRLERLIPEAAFGVAHGQMPEKELAEVMTAFGAGEIDVLLSTSIIESGLDFPNANTLIVDRADTFGLGQLYQLRGRVGRGAVRAYAYFFFNSRMKATEEALQRLQTLAEHSYLGAGYSLALQDLEMRGAGELLGRRQHGHIAAIGFHFYTQLLSAAVQRLRADRSRAMPLAELAVQPPLPVTIDLAIPAAIAPDYVADRELRLQLYRRLANLRSQDELAAMQAELSDRFGPPPLEVENLLYQLRVKLVAAAAQVEAVTSENGQILIQLPPERVPQSLLEGGWAVRQSKRGIWLEAGREWREQLVQLLGALGAAD